MRGLTRTRMTTAIAASLTLLTLAGCAGATGRDDLGLPEPTEASEETTTARNLR